MASSTRTHPPLNWVITIFFFFFFSQFSSTLSDPRITEAGLSCGKTRAPAGTNYIPTFVKEMEHISQLVTAHHYATYLVNSTLPIYALAQCHHDLSHTDCLLCYAASRTKLPRCLPAVSGRIYYDGCFLRYDNYSFYQESVDPFYDTVKCSSESGSEVVGNSTRLEFAKIVERVVKNVTGTAVLSGGFGVAEERVGEEEAVYALAQCWKSVSRDGCRACLEKAGNGVRGCVPKRDGRGLNAGCYLRYSAKKFYSDGKETRSRSGLSSRGVIVAIVLAVAAFFMLSLFAAYAGYMWFKRKEDRKKLGLLSMKINRSNLNFKYEALEKATNYFDPSRKLGQGGAGSVFKGTLPDGKVIAVKRLIFNTRQWVDEFFNEVNLISGIQHKNLVKLLGCSIEGPESLLVYEYVPNKSLDQFLFDKNNNQSVNWKQRFDIIVGTAEGLAYLHGGSQTRIIHRDIKSSNILLDEKLTPKIADFGLVRCLAADKSHLSTGIAGTLGYMAPEYLVRGQLTDKADVYSFGVLVLEIVCGRRSNMFTEDSGSLLQTVWKHYKLNRLSECVDPRLKDDFPVKEASNVLQIGLLCTQAAVAFRPSMDEVVQMLTHEECEIPMPNQPPFLNATMLETASSTRSCSTNSLISNAMTKVEVSSFSTESMSVHSTVDPSVGQASKEGFSNLNSQ